jgi:hypothetical protein
MAPTSRKSGSNAPARPTFSLQRRTQCQDAARDYEHDQDRRPSACTLFPSIAAELVCYQQTRGQWQVRPYGFAWDRERKEHASLSQRHTSSQRWAGLSGIANMPLNWVPSLDRYRRHDTGLLNPRPPERPVSLLQHPKNIFARPYYRTDGGIGYSRRSQSKAASYDS